MITNEQLKLLCELSKLGIPEEKYSEYANDMEKIIELMDTIGDSDYVYNAKDMSKAVKFCDLREDNEIEFNNMEKIVNNAPKEREYQFAVPKVVD